MARRADPADCRQPRRRAARRRDARHRPCRRSKSKLQLKTHVEKRNFPVLALVMSREDRAFGPRLRVASRPCFDLQQWIAAGQPRDQLPEWRRVPPCGGVHDSSLGWTQHSSVTMPAFAEYLRDYVRGWVLTPRERPARVGPHLVAALKAPDIVDRTGLRGRYDMEFSAFYPTAALMTRFPFLTSVFEPLGFSSIPRALDEQLGLKLVEAEAPYDVIVIDSAERPMTMRHRDSSPRSARPCRRSSRPSARRIPPRPSRTSPRSRGPTPDSADRSGSRRATSRSMGCRFAC